MTTAPPPEPEVSAGYGAGWYDGVKDLGLRIFQPHDHHTPVEWAEAFRRWKDGTPYRIDETPHVREVLEAYDDPEVEEIVIMKPSQSGLTEGLAVNVIGYHVDQDPRDLLLVIPSDGEAKKWSKKKLQPMIDATPRVQGKIGEGSRKSSNTMLEKTFPGGSIGIVGSNSGRGFRMVTIGTVIGDDVDGWDSTAGKGAHSEGDQVVLIRRRTDRIPDRKLVWISTPVVEDGRISRLYEQTDRRGEWHVPCPHCGEMQVLQWGGVEEPHGLKWDKKTVRKGQEPEPGQILRGTTLHLPDTAHYICEASGCRIEESKKRWMEARGQYLAEDGLPVRQPGARRIGLWLHGSLTITLPGSEWPRLIRNWLEVKDFADSLKSFTNTVLAEPWEDRTEAPEWTRLYERREDYDFGICPEGVEFITVGVDVQDTWVTADAWGWGHDRESWLIESIESEGAPKYPDTWEPITAMLHRVYPTEDGRELPVARLAVDTGHDQTSVVHWAHSAGDRRIMLVKGEHWQQWRMIVGSPTKSEVTVRGKRTGLLLWKVGSGLIKQETYGFLGLDPPLDGEPYPPGWIHFPMVGEGWCKGMVAEALVRESDNYGFPKRKWEKHYARNEPLDKRSYARAAAEAEGLSRMVTTADGRAPRSQKPKPKKRPKASDDPGRPSGWLDRGRRGRGRGRGRGGWLG